MWRIDLAVYMYFYLSVRPSVTSRARVCMLFAMEWPRHKLELVTMYWALRLTVRRLNGVRRAICIRPSYIVSPPGSPPPYITTRTVTE